MKLPVLELYDEQEARDVAQIIGNGSASAKAVAELDRRRESGEDVRLYLDRKNRTVVVGQAFPMQEHIA